MPHSRLITGEILSLSEHYIHEETFRCSTWSERSMRSTFVCMSVTYWVRVFMNICIPALHKHPLCLNTEWLNVNDDRNNSCSLMNLADRDINHITGHTLFNMCARPAITKLLSHETHIDWQGDLMMLFLYMEMNSDENIAVCVLPLPSAGETSSNNISSTSQAFNWKTFAHLTF